MSKQQIDSKQEPGYAAYRALRHFAADIVRDIRLALDIGVEAKALVRMVKKHATRAIIAQQAELAVEFMASHPEAGAVRWIDGSQYTFVEDKSP